MVLRVYLAGSMTGCKTANALNWRLHAFEKLTKYGMAVYSPTRGKTFDPTKPIATDSEKTIGGPENTTRAINTRDYLDTTKADCLLVFLDTTTPLPSMGTVAEMAWAFDRRIPIVCCVPEDSIYMQHPMVSEFITYRVDTIDEGIAIVVSVLLP